MKVPVTLLVPIKHLALAKSRLRASPGLARRTAEEHTALVLAMALDTMAAANAAAGVTRVVAVTPDDRVMRAAAEIGVETVLEEGVKGLNEALVTAARALGLRGTEAQIGALNADLPALRPAELSAALHLSAGRRAFCRDRHGTGTTLLVAALGEDLNPRFGPWSASAHVATGATELRGHWPSLRCDVDTGHDLATAADLRLGGLTQSVVGGRGLCA